MIKKLTPFHRDLEIRSLKSAIDDLKQKKLELSLSQQHQLALKNASNIISLEKDYYQQKEYRKKFGELMGFLCPDLGRQLEDVRQESKRQKLAQSVGMEFQDEEELIRKVKKKLKTEKVKQENSSAPKKKRIRRAKEKICECCKKSVKRHVCEHSFCVKPCLIQEKAMKMKCHKTVSEKSDDQMRDSEESDKSDEEYELVVVKQEPSKVSPRKTRRRLMQNGESVVELKLKDAPPMKKVVEPKPKPKPKPQLQLQPTGVPSEPKKRGRKKKVVVVENHEEPEKVNNTQLDE